MTARTLMVQGTTSNAGKSLLATALCRIYRRRGLRVAPFKAQNMALNAAVTPDGAEIGRAQYAQAEAAGVVACADMNPILLKPEGLSASQVVVLGRARGSLHFREYLSRADEWRDIAACALERLRAAHELVILEGAGSPAEVNLPDIANMWIAARAEAPVILVADIERGGAMASLVGTLELLAPADRARVRALVINKLHGDPELFAEGARFLERRTGVPVAGVIPHLRDAAVAAEDSLDLSARADMSVPAVAVVRLPHISNFDEFQPLARIPGLTLRWCARPEELDGAALVIVPGSKRTVVDLGWLRSSGLAAALTARARAGGRILGICGGYQMLGRRILDPLGVESEAPETAGLDLLPAETRFGREKVTASVEFRLRGFFGDPGPLRGYQIHCGRVTATGAPFAELAGGPEGAVAGSVAGTTLHGLFENRTVLAAVAAALGLPSPPDFDPYDRVADHFERWLRMDLIDRLIG